MNRKTPPCRLLFCGKLFLFLILIVVNVTVEAQIVRSFTPRFTTNDTGDIKMIGNTVMTCPPGADCTAAQNGIANPTGLLNNAFNMVYVDVDGGANSTFNSSEAALMMPAGASILWAGLYWGGDTGGAPVAPSAAQRGNVLFATPGSGYMSIMAVQVDNIGTRYQGYADVTNLVTAAGNGTYRAANVQSGIGADRYAGWSLIVAFKDNTMPARNLTVFDGFAAVTSTTPAVSINVGPFTTPPFGQVKTKVGMVSYEGDFPTLGDFATLTSPISLATTVISDFQNPSNNLFNSTISNEGNRVSSKFPDYVNQLGFDIDYVNMNGALANGDTSATIELKTAGDFYYPGVVTFATDLYTPEVIGRITKTVSDINGAPLQPGDILEYTIDARNDGNDPAINFLLTDPIPGGTIYLPGSLLITSGPNIGPKTDSPGDDQAEFNSGANLITFRLGSGATASNGGVLAQNGGSTTIKFRVQVDPNIPGNSTLYNQAATTYKGLTLGTIYTTLSDSDSTSGDQPAQITVLRPDLTVTKTHSGNFSQGAVGTSYTVTANNIGGAQTNGSVIVTDILPAGLTPTAAAGTGWTCGISGQTVTCNRSDVLPANSSFSPVTITLDVASNAAASLTNTASISGGGELNTTNNSASDPTTITSSGTPDLTVGKSHSGNLSQGQTGAIYTLTATNSGTAPTYGTVTVTDTVPADLIPTAASGTGWSCGISGQVVTCTRTDTLNSGSAYPAISLTVNVSATAASSITNTANVSGGGETNTTNNSASDPTTINASGGVSDLTIAKSHTGNFTQGQNGVTYSILASNNGTAPTSGTVSVIENPPSGFSVTAISGSGWSCNLGTLTCTRTNVLSSGASYPPIVVTGNISLGAPSSFTNTAAISGGGETNTANNSASDPTTINLVPDLMTSKSHSGNFTRGQIGATYSIGVMNDGLASSSGVVTITDVVPSDLTPTAASGTGWSCGISGQTVTCTRSDALTSGGLFPAITLTVNVSSTAPTTIVNTALVSGGGDVNTSNNSAADSTTVNVSGGTPDLTVAKSHSGNFQQGQIGVAYILTATNSGTAPTAGIVTISDTLPGGLTPTSASGAGWSCGAPVGQTISCTRSDLINSGASYSNITVYVDVAINAPLSVTNTATISGGGETNTTNNSAADPTTILAVSDLTVTKTHSGNFVQGQIGATYTITASNVGTGISSGVVTLTETPPVGLTITSLAGSGWTCNAGTLICTRSDSVNPGSAFPPIIVTVNVAANAPNSIINRATIGGGGELNTANNSAADTTTVNVSGGVPDLTITKSHSGNFQQGQTGATYTITPTNSGTAITTGTITVTDTVPAGMTPTAASGTGWSCGIAGQVATCTRTDALNAGAAFPPITLSVNVSGTAATPLVNSAVVSGGGETLTTNNTANDSTIINVSGGVPDLTVAKSHSGSFSQGQNGAIYTITPTNSGTAATTGTVTVTDIVPTGMTPVGAVGTGWSCTISGQTVTCTRSNSVNAGSSYPAITLTVNVAQNAATPIVNSATVAGGGQTNTTNDSANDSTVVTALPDMIVTKTHVGSFMQGQTGAAYTLTTRNIGAASVGAQVTVSDTLPAGLTATAISGTNWTCTLSSLTCTRNTGTFTLATNTNYEPITITVNVDANAPSSVTNFANVSGGGEVNTTNDNASDLTNINPTGTTAPDVTIAKSHTGNFTQGQTGATYNLTVTNSGNAATSGTVTVTDSPFPVGLTATAMSGTGWSCNLSTLACTRADALAIGASYPVITVTANVASNASANITNTANVSGGGETNTSNNIATDPTTVNPSGALPDMTVSKSHVGNFSQGQTGTTYTLIAKNIGAGTSTGTVSVTDTLPSGLTATAISGSGWSCNLASLTCTRSDALAASTSYPPITVTVNVAGNSNPIVNNTVGISGGGETNTSNNNASDSTTITPAPDLVINKSHIGNFQQGQNGATYALTATNQGGSPTSGVVTVTDTLPSSLTATAISGSGWTCDLGTLTCTRSDVLNASSSYPPITLTVNVASNAPSGIINIGNVSGGSESNTANNSDSDLTTVNTTGGTPDLTIAKSHIGSFQQFQTGASYTLTVTNSGTAATNGTPVSLTDTLPTGLTATAISGTGWTCNLGSLTCTRSDVLNAGSTYPPITMTVNVAGNAPANITNTANTNGGGETNTTNNSASDPTTITTVPDLTIAKSHAGNFTQGQAGVTYSVTASNVGSAASSGTYTMIDTLPTGLTPTAAAGTGWTCGISGQTVTCTRANAIAANAAAPVITITANVSATAATPLINSASISGGSEMNPLNNTANDSTTINPTGGAVDLVIAKTHSGNFTQGQTGATYALTVTNNGTISSSGNVSVVENPPAGLTLTAISGTGWTCTLASRTCTRSDALNSTASYPPITATVTVSATATSPLINNTTVSGGGDAVTTNNAANDSTIINVSGGTPDFTVAKTHTGNFTQGQTNATYSIVATNSGNAPSSGTVTVVENPPTGLTLTAIAGTGWTCTLASRTCTRADALSAGASYPPIIATVSVATNATLGTNSLTNNATVAGGGETNTTNDAANDPTTIVGVPDVTIAKSHTGNFTQGQIGATYTISASNPGTATTTGTTTVSDSLPSGMTPTTASGTGWSCNITGQNVSCTSSNAIASGANFPAITILVNVSGTASGTLTNVATISGGGETNTGNNTANDPTTVNGTPDLTIVKSHTGNFTQSQTNALYAIAVTNSGSGPTSGVVTVNDNVPTGLTPTAASGTGWSCTISGQNVNCTRSDSINAGISYPPISLTVSVAGTAPNSLTNSATVSGGGETNTTNNTFNDVTNINQVPDLTIAKTHAGSFVQGQTGATYSINVSNIGAAPTNTTVLVTDTLPASLTPTSASGAGWNCTISGQSVSCSRNDILSSGTSFPLITIIVNVSASAPANVTNTASVSGGGDTTSGNNSANDPTTINPPNTPDLTVAKTHTGDFSIGQIGAAYTVIVSNVGTGTTTAPVTMNDTVPTGLTPTAASGTGWSCTISGQLVSCNRSDALNLGTNFPPIAVSVNVENSAPLGTNSVTNIASVNGGGEINTANNSANDPTTIIVLVAPSVSLVKSVLPVGDQPPGTDLTYKIIFQNEGGSAAKSLIISDAVPANTDFKIGSPGLNLGTTGITFTTEFSNDGGTTWTYVPTSGGGGADAGYDRSVTHIRWKVTAGNLSYIAPNNVGDISFAVKIR